MGLMGTGLGKLIPKAFGIVEWNADFHDIHDGP